MTPKNTKKKGNDCESCLIVIDIDFNIEKLIYQKKIENYWLNQKQKEIEKLKLMNRENNNMNNQSEYIKNNIEKINQMIGKLKNINVKISLIRIQHR